MSTYRDDLDTAKEHVNRLEAELGTLPRVKNSGLWIVAVLIVIGSVMAGLVVRRVAASAEEEATHAGLAPHESALPYSPTELELYDDPPVVLEPRPDGAIDLYALANAHRMIFYPSGGRSESQVWIVAYDGKTFARRWISPEAWSEKGRSYLVKSGSRLVVVADKLVAVVSDVDGKTLDKRPYDTAPTSVCATVDGQVNVVTGSLERTLQVASGTIAFSNGHGPCLSLVCRPGEVGPCFARNAFHETPRMSARRRYEDSDVIAFLGDAVPDPADHVGERRPPPYARVYARATDDRSLPGMLLWEGRLSEGNDIVTLDRSVECLTPDTLVTGYVAQDGPVRVIARDLKTGTIRWSMAQEHRARPLLLSCTKTNLVVVDARSIHFHRMGDGQRQLSIDSIK